MWPTGHCNPSRRIEPCLLLQIGLDKPSAIERGVKGEKSKERWSREGEDSHKTSAYFLCDNMKAGGGGKWKQHTISLIIVWSPKLPTGFQEITTWIYVGWIKEEREWSNGRVGGRGWHVMLTEKQDNHQGQKLKQQSHKLVRAWSQTAFKYVNLSLKFLLPCTLFICTSKKTCLFWRYCSRNGQVKFSYIKISLMVTKND